jgi:hypothetical protein
VGEPDSTPDAGSYRGDATSGATSAESVRADPEGRARGDTDDVPVLHSTRLPSASTAALRSSLEDQQARTQELRTALDELRTALEGDAGGATRSAPPSDDQPPRRPPGRPPRRRTLILAVAGAALVLVIVVPLAVAQRSSRTAIGAARSTSGSSLPTASLSGLPTSAPPGSAPSGGPSGSASGAGGSVAPTTSRSVPVLTTRPMAWPGGPVLVPPGLPSSGPGADAPGLDLTAAIDPDKRHVDVYERVVPRPGTTSLHLAQASLGLLPRVLRGARPAVTELQVELDGRAVRPVAGRTGWQVTAPGGGMIGRATFRYRLLGAYVRQVPAPPGRVTTVIRPLAAEVVLADDDPVVVRVHDQRVGGVTCPTGRRPLCAVTNGRMHTATLPSGATGIVLAQVNLR